MYHNLYLSARVGTGVATSGMMKRSEVMRWSGSGRKEDSILGVSSAGFLYLYVPYPRREMQLRERESKRATLCGRGASGRDSPWYNTLYANNCFLPRGNRTRTLDCKMMVGACVGNLESIRSERERSARLGA